MMAIAIVMMVIMITIVMIYILVHYSASGHFTIS
jgi:hypothetical protein